MKKLERLALLGLSLALILSLTVIAGQKDKTDSADSYQGQNSAGAPRLYIGHTVLSLLIADTPALQEKGLGGRLSLRKDFGMLFIFDHPDSYGFWMKDMNFSLDLFWISADWRIVTIKEDVSPLSYPEAFFPDAPARYVLETNAGFARAARVKVGDRVTFSPAE